MNRIFLKNNPTVSHSPPLRMPFLIEINPYCVQVSCGSGNTCGLRDNGYMECWGKNQYGQSSPPQYIRFKQISVGNFGHSCGITVENRSICWGLNDRGQLGIESGKRKLFFLEGEKLQ
jgi:alpha-tubulin suppressor-like RCC1 family protein